MENKQQYILVDRVLARVFTQKGVMETIGENGPVAIFTSQNPALSAMLFRYPLTIAQPVSGRISN